MSTRFVQLTPPGSACSIAIGTGLSSGAGQEEAEPGSMRGMQLVVDDIDAARAELAGRGVDVSEVSEFPWGSFVSSAIRTATAGTFRPPAGIADPRG